MPGDYYSCRSRYKAYLAGRGLILGLSERHTSPSLLNNPEIAQTILRLHAQRSNPRFIQKIDCRNSRFAHNIIIMYMITVCALFCPTNRMTV